MNKAEYLSKACNSTAFMKYEWLLHLFVMVTGEIRDKETEYHLSQIDGKHHYYAEGEYHPITDAVDNQPLFVPDDEIIMVAGSLANLSETVTTTVMRVVINQYCFVWQTGDTFPFHNHYLGVTDVEGILNTRLVDDPPGGGTIPGKVTATQFQTVQRAIETLGKLSNVIVFAASEKSLLAPTGIAEYKKKLLKEFQEKGIDLNSSLGATEYQNALKAYDRDYLSDDPAFKHGISGKTATSRMKIHGSFGKESGFGGGDFADTITRNLRDGLPENAEQYALGANTARAGSTQRGKETMKGGVLSTLLSRLVYDLIIDPTDCGSKEYISVKIINSGTSYRDQYTDKGVKTDEAFLKANIGKYVKLRNPLYCKSKGFCKVCVGARLGSGDKTTQLYATDISSKVLYSSMKGCHSLTLESVKSNLDDVLS